MKVLKVAFAVAIAALVGPAYAFHEGGVATCESCHTMHNSSAKETGSLGPQMTNNNLGVGTTNPYLLQGVDASSTCLACHASGSASSYRVLSTATFVNGAPDVTKLNFGPGGDFAWLQVGPRKGHNVYAADYGTYVNNAAETRKPPPGAGTITWDGVGFSCVSCHDPHGQTRFKQDGTQARPAVNFATGEVTGFTGMAPIAESGSYGGAAFAEFDANANTTAGAYRLLGGNGWKPRSASATAPAIAADPPIALAPSTYNKSETTFALNGAGHTGQTVVAYVSGMSEWCASCHPKMHGEAASGSLANTLDKHPSGASATLGAGIAANYNKYVKTGDLSGSKAYDGLVPVELGGTRAAAANLPVDTAGTVNITVASTSNVMCLTCHRAHGSGFDFMMRWDPTYEFNDIGSAAALTAGYAPNAILTIGYQARAATQTAPQYGNYQRDMCNKCHIKD